MLDGSETDLVGHYVSELRGRLPLYDFLVAAIKKVGLTGERLSGEFSSARGELAVAVQRLVDGSVAFSAEDISDRVRASRALEHSASHDSLSGLPNRAALLRHLDAALELAAPVALVMIDLDEFKDVNDALGHHMGDRLLQSVAERLNRRFPELLVARLGGDEFAILATEVDLDAARSIAEGVTHLFSEPFPLAEVMVTGSASVGVAAAPLHANSTAELMRRADVAMYAAKRQRTGWAEYDEGFDESSVRRLQLASRLRDAFDCSELELWFQPIVTVDDQRVVDLEALVRWRHPELGMVMPDEFIPLAEMSGAIRPLTRFVISETIRVGHELVARGTDVGVSCNLSARNLYEHDLVEWFDDLIAERGLPAGGFGMELTETALMEDSPAARAVLDAFVARGVTVAMDDFGTGYSSLAQLRALPIEVVKIDRSFVMGVAVRPDDRTIVRSVIELAHGLGRKVVAEGVDDAATLATLAELGCERAQGYYFARPLPERRLFEFLEAPSNVAPWNNAPWNAETPAEAGVSQESG
jgi:diguanylate cyclase (GGDEF)-like protein